MIVRVRELWVHFYNTFRTPTIQPAIQPALVRLAVLMMAGVLVAACASAPKDDPEALAEYQEINDPLEPLNRAVFEFNRGVDTMLLRPAATFYKGVVPPPIQSIVGNFLNNLKTPVVLLNDLLQGESERAMTTLTRFAINTTVGVLGFGDPATDMGYPDHSEDFGQTMATWGVNSGPYLVLPILGPSNPRDTVGKVVDVLTDPVWHYAQNTDKEHLTWKRRIAEAVDFRARNLDAINDLEKTSLDYYAAVRSLYRQVREDEIHNGKVRRGGLPAMAQKQAEEMYALDAMEDPDAQDDVLATKN